MRTIAVEDVAELLTALHAEGCWEKTVAGALATLHRAVRFAPASRSELLVVGSRGPAWVRVVR